jgi:hypothetical protein
MKYSGFEIDFFTVDEITPKRRKTMSSMLEAAVALLKKIDRQAMNPSGIALLDGALNMLEGNDPEYPPEFETVDETEEAMLDEATEAALADLLSPGGEEEPLTEEEVKDKGLVE